MTMSIGLRRGRADRRACSRCRKRLSIRSAPDRPRMRSENVLVVLLREDRGGHQHGHLHAVLHGLERGPDGHLGLAEPHVAAHQAVHGRPAAPCRP